MTKEEYLIFGPDSAEDDKFLHAHFIETGSFRKVKNRQKLIVVGRKGSGKSAIFHHLKPSNHKERYVKLQPNKYSIEIFQRYAREYGKSNFSGLTGFSGAWKFVLLYELGQSLLNLNQNSSDIVESSTSVLKIWAEQNVKFSDVQKFASNRLDSLKENLIPMDGYDIQFDLIKEHLKENVVHILIDDLDNVWQNSAICAEYLYGLISCIRDLVRENNLYVTLFIREDMFTTIQKNFHQIDNIRQLIEHIGWDPTLLRLMVGKRIQNYLKIQGSDYLNYWSKVFPSDVNGYDSYKYMVERTQLRPRELLQFCAVAWDASKSGKRNRVHPIDVITSERIYSTWKYNDLCSEYGSRYTSLSTLFDLFSGQETIFSKETVFEKIKFTIDNNLIGRFFKDDDSPITNIEVLKFLYECGFLRARVIENGRPRFKASSTAPNFNLMTVVEFDLHPAYRRSLNG